MGGAGASGDPTGGTERKSHGRVSRLDRERLWHALARDDDDVDGDRHDIEVAGGPYLLCLGPRRPSDDAGYSVLVIADGAAFGVRGAAAGRVRSGVGGRC